MGRMGPVELVRELRSEGIRDERVLAAMAEVPRDDFVLPEDRDLAWENQPLAIGRGQTISQPFVVAFMVEALHLQGHERVLEVGTGSGYQAAVLSKLCSEVYTLEIIPELLQRAQEALRRLGISNVHARVGDGYQGWPEAAPFDSILVSAATERIPEPLVAQLRHQGTMIVPVGPHEAQRLLLVHRTVDGVSEVEASLAVRFVPMTGEARKG
jgi:protein-L-isoaspartate(D-aspartate) O-methyltransferase